MATSEQRRQAEGGRVGTADSPLAERRSAALIELHYSRDAAPLSSPALGRLTIFLIAALVTETLQSLFGLSNLWTAFPHVHSVVDVLRLLRVVVDKACDAQGFLLCVGLCIFWWRGSQSKRLVYRLAVIFCALSLVYAVSEYVELLVRKGLRLDPSVAVSASADRVFNLIWRCSGPAVLAAVLQRELNGKDFDYVRLSYAVTMLLGLFCFCRTLVLLLGFRAFSKTAFYQLQTLLHFSGTAYMLELVEPIADMLDFPLYEVLTVFTAFAAAQSLLSGYRYHRVLIALVCILACLPAIANSLKIIEVLADRFFGAWTGYNQKSSPYAFWQWLLIFLSWSLNRASPFPACAILLTADRPWRHLAPQSGAPETFRGQP